MKNDPFAISASLASKLASVVVHADELFSPDGRSTFDEQALLTEQSSIGEFSAAARMCECGHVFGRHRGSCGSGDAAEVCRDCNCEGFRAASPLPAEPPPTTFTVVAGHSNFTMASGACVAGNVPIIDLPATPSAADPQKEREHCNQCGAPILRDGEHHAVMQPSERKRVAELGHISCAWCEATFDKKATFHETMEMMADHMLVCEKHPFPEAHRRAESAESRVAALQAQLETQGRAMSWMNDMLIEWEVRHKEDFGLFAESRRIRKDASAAALSQLPTPAQEKK